MEAGRQLSGSSLNQIEGKWSRPDGTKETPFLVVQQPIEFTGPVRINPKVIKEANKEGHYTVEAEYPQIEGDARFDKFNREARGYGFERCSRLQDSETAAEPDADGGADGRPKPATQVRTSAMKFVLPPTI